MKIRGVRVLSDSALREIKMLRLARGKMRLAEELGLMRRREKRQQRIEKSLAVFALIIFPFLF